MMKLKRKGIWVLLLSLGVFAGCSGEKKEPEPVVTVKATTAKRTLIQQVIRTEAVLYPKDEAAITPKITAPVRKFFVNRGARVHKGELLAVLENLDIAASVTENKGALEQAQANYTTTKGATLPEALNKAELEVRSSKENLEATQKLYDSRQMLYKQGALPRKDLDQTAVSLVQARAQYEIAEQHLAALQSIGKTETIRSASGQLSSAEGKYQGSLAQLGYTEIRSPINGVVTDRPLYPGETAPAGTPLITVMNTSSVIAKAHIPEEQAALLKLGDPATITAPGGEKIHGKVTVVSPATDPNSTTVEIWTEAPNPSGSLRPGTTIQVAMVARTVPDALVVPSTSILQTTEGGNSVMVVGSDGLAHLTPVETGIQSGDLTQITKGVQAGQMVVVSGGYGLPDNTRVKVANAPGDTESKRSVAEKE